MNKLQAPAMPKLNKNDLLIVNSTHFNTLINSINYVFEQYDAEIASLHAELEKLHKDLASLHSTTVSLQDTCDARHMTTSKNITEIKDNVAYLAAVISEGGFLNE